MILYVTDRGQCYWSSIMNIESNFSFFYGEYAKTKEDITVVRKYVFDRENEQAHEITCEERHLAGIQFPLDVRIL